MKRMMKKGTLLSLVAVVLAACSTTVREQGENLLRVKLEETEVSLTDLFSKIEIIPLETNDTALMDHIHRVREVDGKYYILSEDYPSFNYITTMVFDTQGNFLHTVGKKGQGPGEYPWLIYDMAVDTEKDRVYMMSPSGTVYLYRTDGSFIRKMNMPEGTYHGIQLLVGNRLLSWAGSADIDRYAMSVLDADSAQLIKGLWKDYAPINWAVSNHFAYQYRGKTYFTSAIDRQVFEIVSDSLRVAYEWDFGEDNYDASEVRSKLKGLGPVEANDKWNEIRRTGCVRYSLLRQGQTDRYYYANFLGRYASQGVIPEENRYSLFYDKQDGRSYYFKKTTEGIVFRPDLITEEAIYQLIPTEDLELLLPVLEEAEKVKVSRRVEDDNPCLVKFIP